jgi:hypothetical protein
LIGIDAARASSRVPDPPSYQVNSREKLVADFSSTQVKRDQKRSRHRDAVDQGEEHPPLPWQSAPTLAGFEHLRRLATS